MNEQKPSQNQARGYQGELGKPASIAIKNDLNYEQQIKENDNAGHYPCGCGAKAKEIGHKTILAVSVKTPLKVGK
jgi:hypothetical protein